MTRQRIAVIDYGMGNLRSVGKALEHVAGADSEVVVSGDRDVIAAAERVVFPGQGAIRDCMAALRSHGLAGTLVAVIAERRPLLGICIGLQALLESSEEHRETAGLALVAGDVRRFPADMHDARTGERLKVPHMGWNQVRFTRPHPLLDGIDDGTHFYFVHSYYAVAADPRLAIGRTEYGIEFTSAIARENVFAVQFHPEKSAAAGLRLLRNFVAWDGRE